MCLGLSSMVERVHFKTKNSAQKILSVNLKNLLIRKWYPIQNQRTQSHFLQDRQYFLVFFLTRHLLLVTHTSREACRRFERSDWFLVAPYFAIQTVSMETAKAVYFSSNNPANSK